MTEVGRKTRTTGSTPNLPALPINPNPIDPASLDTIPAAFAAHKGQVSPATQRRRSSLLNIAVMTLVVPGLFATVALPAYAFSPADDSAASADAAVEFMELKQDGAQSVQVAADAAPSALTRDGYTTTSAAEILRAELAAAYASYSGPTVSDYLANPPYPNFDLGAVANVALQYQGVPYVFGGADPSGFDCSGFVMFVYAQFGISLPHSVTGSAAVGTAIATEAGLPGDIVIMDGHSGIYLGNGMFIDAPYEGKTVQVRPIYDSYYLVRIGI